jgi:hypothetical protein
MSYSTLRLCSGGGAFEVIPSPKLNLDLSGLAPRIRENGIAVIDARVMLILQMDPEVTVSRDGRILIKSQQPAVARSVFARLQDLLGLPTIQE